jgi:hypothetical protein
MSHGWRMMRSILRRWVHWIGVTMGATLPRCTLTYRKVIAGGRKTEVNTLITCLQSFPKVVQLMCCDVVANSDQRSTYTPLFFAPVDVLATQYTKPFLGFCIPFFVPFRSHFYLEKLFSCFHKTVNGVGVCVFFLEVLPFTLCSVYELCDLSLLYPVVLVTTREYNRKRRSIVSTCRRI